jgi:hypothetical protein
MACPRRRRTGLPGIHSGTVTLLRIAGPNDRFYEPHTLVVQYVATYTFFDLRRTPLKKGEITAQGMNLLDRTRRPLPHIDVPNSFALTGGTDAYAKTRGKVIELYNRTNDRELYIEL